MLGVACHGGARASWRRATGWRRPSLYVAGLARLLGRHRLQRFAAAARGRARRATTVVSGFGYALGYLGGGLLFAVNVLMTLKPALVRARRCGARRCAVSFVMVGVWWLVFALPLRALRAREAQPARPAAGARRRAAGLRANCARTLRRDPRATSRCCWFLVAYWLYIDGVNTIIKMAVDYGLSLGFDQSRPDRGAAAHAVRRLSRRRSPSAGSAAGSARATGIFLALAVYVGGDRATPTSSTTSRDFYVLAVVDRPGAGRHPVAEPLATTADWCREGKSSEFFGFYNMMGKFAAVLGPMLVGVSSRASPAIRGCRSCRAPAVRRRRGAADRGGAGRATRGSAASAPERAWPGSRSPGDAVSRPWTARARRPCRATPPGIRLPARRVQRRGPDRRPCVAQLAGSSA